MPRKPENLAGKQFGHLTAISPTSMRYNGYVVWLCRCECGKEVLKHVTALKSDRRPRHCGCHTKLGKDIAGKLFGSLTAIRRTPDRKGAMVVWVFRCECGREVRKTLGDVTFSGGSTHCGCKRIRRRKARGKIPPKGIDRAKRFLAMRKLDGLTDTEIGQESGLSRERVGQIISALIAQAGGGVV